MKAVAVFNTEYRDNNLLFYMYVYRILDVIIHFILSLVPFLMIILGFMEVVEMLRDFSNKSHI